MRKKTAVIERKYLALCISIAKAILNEKYELLMVYDAAVSCKVDGVHIAFGLLDNNFSHSTFTQCRDLVLNIPSSYEKLIVAHFKAVWKEMCSKNTMKEKNYELQTYKELHQKYGEMPPVEVAECRESDLISINKSFLEYKKISHLDLYLFLLNKNYYLRLSIFYEPDKKRLQLNEIEAQYKSLSNYIEMMCEKYQTQSLMFKTFIKNGTTWKCNYLFHVTKGI